MFKNYSKHFLVAGLTSLSIFTLASSTTILNLEPLLVVAVSSESSQSSISENQAPDKLIESSDVTEELSSSESQSSSSKSSESQSSESQSSESQSSESQSSSQEQELSSSSESSQSLESSSSQSSQSDEIIEEEVEIPSEILNGKYKHLFERIEKEEKLNLIVELNPLNSNLQVNSLQGVELRSQAVESNQREFLESLSEKLANKIISKSKYRPNLNLVVETEQELFELIHNGLVNKIVINGKNKRQLTQTVPNIGVDPYAYDSGYDGAGKTVVILDSGYQANHPFFGPRVVEEFCFSSEDPLQQYDSTCAGDAQADFGPGSASVCEYGAYECDHGTHVAGIAAGNGGVAKNSTLILGNIFTFDGVYGDLFVFDNEILNAIDEVYFNYRFNYDISSINMSFGQTPPPGLACNTYPLYNDFEQMFALLRNEGIASIGASGNESTGTVVSGVSWPACSESAIAVGSTGEYLGDPTADVVTFFSNTGLDLDLLAPGSGIESSVTGGGFDTFPGTSMATPHVTGLWVILDQYCEDTGACDPNNVGEILDILQRGGIPITDTRPGSNNITQSKIQIASDLETNLTLNPLSGTNNSGVLGRVNEGDILALELAITNNGEGTTVRVNLDQILPPGLEFVSIEKAIYQNGVIQVGDVNNGETINVILNVLVTDYLGGSQVITQTIGDNSTNQNYLLFDTDTTNNNSELSLDVNDRPTALPDNLTLLADQTEVQISVIGNDSDSDGIIDPTSCEITRQPQVGSASCDDQGNITFNYNTEDNQTEVVTLEYQICDSENSCTRAELTINNLETVPLTPINLDLIRTGGFWEEVSKAKPMQKLLIGLTLGIFIALASLTFILPQKKSKV